MRLTLVAGPTVEPIDLAEVKAHVRPADTDEDALFDKLIAVARHALDGRAGLLGRALIQQTWKLKLDRFVRSIEMPLPPLISIDEIAYTAANGAAQTVDLQTITVEGIGDAAPAIVRPVNGTSWPATASMPEAVAITFKAGYGPAPTDVPAPIRHALLMHCAHLYENREAVTLGSGFMKETPAGYRDLIGAYRIWRF